MKTSCIVLLHRKEAQPLKYKSQVPDTLVQVIEKQEA